MSSSVVSKDHVLIGLPHKKRNRVSIRDTAMIASGKRSLTTILGPVNNLYTKVKHGAQEGRLRSLL